MTSTDNRIHIALSLWDLTDDYNRHAGATLVSILEHCSEPVVAHLLYDEKLCIGKEKETEYNKSCYQKIADKYGCELQYHHVELPEWVTEIPAVKHWTPGSLMRLNLPDILPTLEKILYLDCDIVVLTDIADIWKSNINAYYLAACREQINIDGLWHKKSRNYFKHMQIPINVYFNSGLLLMNLNLLRDGNMTNVVYEYIHQHPYIHAPDQDGLNWYCKGNYLQLDKKYSVLNWQENPDAYNGNCNIHNGKKPWKKYLYKSDDYYWDYLSKTPWCEDRHIFYSYLRSAPDLSKCLPMLEEHFFAHINGTRGQKVRYAMHFIFCIIKSFIKGLWEIVVNR